MFQVWLVEDGIAVDLGHRIVVVDGRGLRRLISVYKVATDVWTYVVNSELGSSEVLFHLYVPLNHWKNFLDAFEGQRSERVASLTMHPTHHYNVVTAARTDNKQDDKQPQNQQGNSFRGQQLNSPEYLEAIQAMRHLPVDVSIPERHHDFPSASEIAALIPPQGMRKMEFFTSLRGNDLSLDELQKRIKEVALLKDDLVIPKATVRVEHTANARVTTTEAKFDIPSAVEIFLSIPKAGISSEDLAAPYMLRVGWLKPNIQQFKQQLSKVVKRTGNLQTPEALPLDGLVFWGRNGKDKVKFKFSAPKAEEMGLYLPTCGLSMNDLDSIFADRIGEPELWRNYKRYHKERLKVGHFSSKVMHWFLPNAKWFRQKRIAERRRRRAEREAAAQTQNDH